LIVAVVVGVVVGVVVVVGGESEGERTYK